MQLKRPAQDVQKARRCQIFTINKVPYKEGTLTKQRIELTGAHPYKGEDVSTSRNNSN